jgi:hypothetical protein
MFQYPVEARGRQGDIHFPSLSNTMSIDCRSTAQSSPLLVDGVDISFLSRTAKLHLK